MIQATAVVLLDTLAQCTDSGVFSVNQDEKSASIKVRRTAGVGGWRA